MALVHTFVTKIFGDLVNLVESPDDQPFQVEFVGYAQVECLVQRIMVGFERPGGGAAVHRLQDRGLHFDKPLTVQQLPQAPDHLGPPDKYLLHIRVGDQV